MEYTDVNLYEFPHSDICGSKVVCTLPQLFAACHVLLRLLVPRHPPCALINLTLFFDLSVINSFNTTAFRFIFLLLFDIDIQFSMCITW